MYPTDLRYTTDHEWVRKESDGTLTVGITAFASKQLGSVVFVELSPAGTNLEQGESFGTVESVKAVSELFLPVAGAVTVVNGGIVDEPERVNEDPYGDGWFVKLKPSNVNDLDELMTAAQYEAFLKQED